MSESSPPYGRTVAIPAHPTGRPAVPAPAPPPCGCGFHLSESGLRLLQGALERCVSGIRLAAGGLRAGDSVSIARGLARANEAMGAAGRELLMGQTFAPALDIGRAASSAAERRGLGECNFCQQPVVWLLDVDGKAVAVELAIAREADGGQIFDPEIHVAHYLGCEVLARWRGRGR